MADIEYECCFCGIKLEESNNKKCIFHSHSVNSKIKCLINSVIQKDKIKDWIRLKNIKIFNSAKFECEDCKGVADMSGFGKRLCETCYQDRLSKIYNRGIIE